MASALPNPVMSRRKLFSIFPGRKGHNDEYLVSIAKPAGKAHANDFSRPRAEDRWCRGFRAHVFPCLAQYRPGVEVGIRLQRGRLVRRRPLHKDLPLAASPSTRKGLRRKTRT